jgi:hypothetical protein
MPGSLRGTAHRSAGEANFLLVQRPRPGSDESHSSVTGLPAPLRILCHLTRENRQPCHEADLGLAERSEEILISELGR